MSADIKRRSATQAEAHGYHHPVAPRPTTRAGRPRRQARRTSHYASAPFSGAVGLLRWPWDRLYNNQRRPHPGPLPSDGVCVSARTLLPLPVRNERGEGHPTADTRAQRQARWPSSPQPSPPPEGGEGKIPVRQHIPDGRGRMFASLVVYLALRSVSLNSEGFRPISWSVKLS